jgi:hypothetical protein
MSPSNDTFGGVKHATNFSEKFHTSGRFLDYKITLSSGIS